MGVEPLAKDNIALCEMKHLSSLKAPKLKLHTTYLPSIHPEYHPKNALEQALKGERNAVSVAYEVMGERSRLLAAAAQAENEDDTPIQVTLYPSNNNIKPSLIPIGKSVCQVFDSQGLMIRIETFDTAMTDALFTSLSTGKLHIHLRVKVKLSKQSH